MMTLGRALAIAKRQVPDRHFTGCGYLYRNNYYVELAPNGVHGAPMDSLYKIDTARATVESYNPVIDGICNLSEMIPLPLV